ncbi:MAG TPA: phospholipid carrier-dependent glycosyltransferase [Planctomycetota bacterium]
MSPFLRAQAVLATDRTIAWAVFCFLLAAYLATFSGLPENPDAEVEFQTTSALVRRQSFALGGTPEAEAIVSIAHQGRQGFNVRRGGPGREQEAFSWSGIGQALVAFPFYVAGSFVGRIFPAVEERHRATTELGIARSEYFEHLLVGLRNPLLGALTGALIVLAARRSGARRLHALLCGLSYGLLTFAWPQARGTLSDVQATAFLFLAFVLAQGALERMERGRNPRLRTLAGFGAALGLAFLTRPVLAPAVAVLVLFFVLRVLQEARSGGRGLPLGALATGLAPALACLALFLWTNHARFGDPLETGYGGVVGLDWFLRAPWQGLLGVTLSPGSGLLYLAPGLLLVVPWFAHALRRGELAVPLLVAGLVLAIGLPHVLIPSWHGAWSYGPRYVLPLIPFLWFPLGITLGLAWERTSSRLAAGVLLVAGGGAALGGVLVEYTTNLDLTLQAAPLAWPAPEGALPVDPEARAEAEAVLDDQRFVASKFDWRFAAPWAHWRILRHRVAGLGESFPVRELYYLESDARVSPRWERARGFRHLAWVDLAQRLDGPTWIGPALVVALLALGLGLLQRAQESA